MITYVVFKRSCNNFKEFASKRKIKVQTNCSISQAKLLCDSFNNNLSSSQKRRGTKFEFMNSEAWNNMKGRKDV